MIKKSISYTDFNGNKVTEDHYFHLSKADLMEMEMSHEGGLHEYLQRIVDSEDGKAIMAEFRKLILKAYGKRSQDGKRFIKTQELRDEFESTEAFSELFMELCMKADSGAEFVNGIVPPNLEEEMAKIASPEPRVHPSDPAAKPVSPDPIILSPADMREMNSDELKSGLATGRYKLS